MSENEDSEEDDRSEIEKLVDEDTDVDEVTDVHLVDESDSSTTDSGSAEQNHDAEDES